MTCSVCGSETTVNIQYIYDKIFKDECDTCIEYNLTGSIYCLCSNENNFMCKKYITSCNNCNGKNKRCFSKFGKKTFLNLKNNPTRYTRVM